MSAAVKQRALLRIGHRPRVWLVRFPTYGDHGEREGAAIGLVAGVSQDGRAVRNDFDRVSIFQRPVFNATWDSTLKRWIRLVPLGDPDFSWSPKEARREVVYRCRPFWYRIENDAECAPALVSVTDRPLEGYALAPMFRNGSDFVYRPCFEMGLDEDGIPHSRAGLTPSCADLAGLMQQARRFDACARTESLADWFSDALLQMVELASWSFYGQLTGNTASGVTASGAALPNVAASVGTLGSGLPCVWRGKENPWKNANSALCDVLLRKKQDAQLELCHLADMRLFDGSLNAHYRSLGDYLMHTSGVTDICGFRSASGLWYPAQRATAGIAIKGAAYLFADHGTGTPVAVAVGGTSDNAMMPTYVKSSPLNWEAADLSNWRAQRFGARLVLDEGGEA